MADDFLLILIPLTTGDIYPKYSRDESPSGQTAVGFCFFSLEALEPVNCSQGDESGHVWLDFSWVG